MPADDRSPYPPEEREAAVAEPVRQTPLQPQPQVTARPSFSDLPPWEDDEDGVNDTYGDEKR
jgi:hypothetical protein